MFNLPAKPSIELKEKKPDARQFSVIPLRAMHDKRLTRGDLINLMALCSYCSPNGFTFVAYSTIAALRGCSTQNTARGMKKIERLGYFEMVRAGYTGLRGALKRVIYDSSLTSEDQASISNHSISETIISEGNTVARYTKGTKAPVNKRVDDNTAITFEQALLVVSQSLKTDSDILTLERLVCTGITLAQLKEAYNIV
jgi:hypothetical protein